MKCSLKYADLIEMYESLNLKRNDEYSIKVYEHLPNNDKHAYTILLSAGMNGCEIPAIFGLYHFVRLMLEEDEPGMKWIRENCKLMIMPCICPGSFDRLEYLSNSVNINRNFNYRKLVCMFKQ